MAAFNGPGIRVLRQYQGQDGKTYVQLSTGETLDTDSDDYRDYYDEGLLYGEDEKGNFYPQEGAHETLKQYQQLVQNNSFENYMKPYFEDNLTGSIAKGLGQSMDKFWEVNPSYKQQYDAKMREDFTKQYLQQNPRNESGDYPEERGPYLDRIFSNIPNQVRDYMMESGNSGVQPGYWSDFSRGIDSVKNELVPTWLGGGDKGLVRDIKNDDSYALYEKNMKTYDIEQGRFGFMDRTKDQLGLLSPLAIPAKFVQSMYKDDYSFDDFTAGRKNDANLVEDIVTDPLTYLTPGIGEGIEQLGKVPGKLNSLIPEMLTSTQKRNLTKLAMEEPLRLIPGRENATNKALAEANAWQKNWYNAPETQQRINQISDDMVAEAKLLDSKEFSPNFEASARKDLWDDFRQNIDDETYNVLFQSNRSKWDKLKNNENHLHQNNSGVSYEWTNPDKLPPDIYQPANVNQTQGFVNRASTLDGIKSVAAHEGNHNTFTSNMIYYGEGDASAVTDMFQEPFKQAMDAKSIGPYYTRPEEVYARIQQIRLDNKIKPGQILTPEDLVSYTDEYSKSKIPTVEPHFMKAFDKQKMAELMNKLPSIGVGLGVPTWLLNQQGGPTSNSNQ